MEAFPFTDAEWEAVREAARAVVNATLADQPAESASHFAVLRTILANLRKRYGEHPVLLETEADFTDDAQTQVALYERAKQAALAIGLSTLSIRMSMARVLLEDLGRPIAARDELLACRDELALDADERNLEEWSDLWKAAV